MFDWLAKIGIEKGQGIFFFLFIAVCLVVVWLYKSSQKSNDKLVEKVMSANDEREQRYLGTIDKLAEVHDIKSELHEFRTEVREANDRQERMLGRVLDRLPTK